MLKNIRNKLVNKVKKSLKRHVKIKVATVVGTLIVTILVSALYTNYKENTYNIMATVAKNTVRKKMADLVLFEGRHEIPAEGNKILHIEASQFDRYGIEFNGKTKIYIDYTSKREDGADKTLLALDACKEGKVSINSIEDIKKSYTHIEESDISTDEKTMTFSLEEADKEMSIKGLDVNGANIIVTRVYVEKPDIVSIEEQKPQETGAESGLVPKDQVLKTWYYYFEYCKESTKSVNEQIGGEYYAPWALVGTMLRETGATTCGKLNAADFNIEKDLNSIYAGPNDMANQVQLVARSSKNNAIGMYQFDPSTFMSSGRVFGNIHHTDREMDTAMGFVRSNPWYTKDITWSGAFYAGSYVEFSKSDRNFVESIITSDDFNRLADVDKQFVYGFMTETHHNYGNLQSSDRQNDVRKLVAIGNNLGSYGISALYEMCDKAGVETFDTDDRMVGYMSTAEGSEKAEITSIFGIGSRYSQGYIEALCGGYKAYSSISKEIANAEKEGGAVGLGNSDFYKIAEYVFSTWREEGFRYKLGGIMTSTTFGKVRIDCSGYTSLCLQKYGLASSNFEYTSASFVNNIMGFEVVNSWDEKQQGDIVAWNGHVCIFAGYDENGKGTWLSWGSDKSAQEKEIPDTEYDSYANKSYNNKNGIILRVPNNTSE